MKVTGRNNHDNATQAELTPKELNTMFRALYHVEKLPDEKLSKAAKQLRSDLCGYEKMTVRFDGRGKNGL